MQSNNNTKKMTMIGILLIMIAMIVSVSFAFFTVNRSIGESFSTRGKAKNDTLQISFTENVSGVSLTNTYPMTDDIGIATSEAYVFEVTNDETDKDLTISVVLEVTSDSTLDDNLVNFSLNDNIRTLGGLTEMAPSTSEYRNSYLIDSFTLTPGATKSSSLQIWINEDGTVDNALNKTWSSKVMVIPELAA